MFIINLIVLQKFFMDCKDSNKNGSFSEKLFIQFLIRSCANNLSCSDGHLGFLIDIKIQ